MTGTTRATFEMSPLRGNLPVSTWADLRVGRFVSGLLVARRSPWENGYVESFNGRLRDECLNAHWGVSLADARAKIEACEAAKPHHAKHQGFNTAREGCCRGAARR